MIHELGLTSRGYTSKQESNIKHLIIYGQGEVITFIKDPATGEITAYKQKIERFGPGAEISYDSSIRTSTDKPEGAASAGFDVDSGLISVGFHFDLGSYNNVNNGLSIGLGPIGASFALGPISVQTDSQGWKGVGLGLGASAYLEKLSTPVQVDPYSIPDFETIKGEFEDIPITPPTTPPKPKPLIIGEL